MQPKLASDVSAETEAARLELALQRDPDDADQWCALGESFNALACTAPDEERAVAWRDKAILALNRAIALRPGFGKAHYALAIVYRTQDMRLAVLELEAAAKCDPDEYTGALTEAEARVHSCTYTLGQLHCAVAPSAQEQPRPEILASEFYFEDGPVRSAIIHSCVSKGTGQFAKAWLFESAEAIPDANQAIAEIAISSAGNVLVSKLRPAPEQTQPIKNVAPQPVAISARRRSAVWMPLALLLIFFGGTFFAYRNLVAPAKPYTAQALAQSALRDTPKIEPANDSTAAAAPVPVESLPADDAELAPADSGPAASAQHDPPTTRRSPEPLPPRYAAPTQRSVPRRATPPVPRTPETVIASNTGSTHAAAAETRLAVRSVDAESSPPELAPAPPKNEAVTSPPASLKDKTTPPATASSAPSPASSSSVRDARVAIVTAPPVRSEDVPNANTWLTSLRADLAACGRPGVLRNDICRETARWSYCHPNRWDTARECAVQRSASAGVSN